MKQHSARLDGLGVTIFAEMAQLATSTGAINLGQGFPDQDGPDVIKEAARRAITEGHNQYPPGMGIPALREAIARHQHRFHGIDVDPQREVVVTTGATEAIAAAVLGLVDPDDDVLVLEPYYDSYRAVIQMAGARHRAVTLRAPDFRLPVDELRAAVTPRTTAIVLNTPHNPTGAVLTADELAAIAEVAIEHDLVVISDEVYEHLTFDVPHVPIATLPGMAERTLTISSAGKTFSFTGWKVGWATGPAHLVSALFGAKQFLSYTSGAPFQHAVAQALDLPDSFFSSFTADLQRRRDLLCAGLESAGFEVFVPDGTYFATTDVAALGFTDGLEFCRSLPGLAGVVAIPHQVFFDDRPDGSNPGRTLVRWAFCKRDTVLEEAAERLRGLRRLT
ncbi:pyridoxal phosphate-dependent aminotransferase [Aeromicrobium duanguangcaii]|uniref:pyridoxal phosphate-dependent aminotransferase n=1 Tax=Aeromicrobium duanguangcaii TaxID=2968086 RepID=UPI0020172CFF|nr:pyridoxal phosphate-dependent aminotransferase [Aeromicrobium duanguangcaii]